MIRQTRLIHTEMNIYFETCVQTKQCECAGTLLIGMLFMLRVMGWRRMLGSSADGGFVSRENDGRGWWGEAECEYWRLDWKLIKLATVLHHSTTAPELSFKSSPLQAAITEAYRSSRWQGSAPNGSGQRWRFHVYVCEWVGVWERGLRCLGAAQTLLWAAAVRTSAVFPKHELKCR